MGRPKLLPLHDSDPFTGSDNDEHQREEHDVSRPAGSSSETGEKKAFATPAVLRCQLSKVDPMGNCMHPGEENHRPCPKLVVGHLYEVVYSVFHS